MAAGKGGQLEGRSENHGRKGQAIQGAGRGQGRAPVEVPGGVAGGDAVQRRQAQRAGGSAEGQEEVSEKNGKEAQVALNIGFYGRVYRQCLEESEKIGKEKGYSREDVFRVAEVIFKQFFSDQTAIAGQVRQTEAVMSGMHSVFQSRGR